MINSNTSKSSEKVFSSRTEAEWQAFRDQADADWKVEMQEEMRIRKEVLPDKLIPFPSPVTHPEIIIEENVDVPMRDGVILRADVYRPKAEGRFPVLMNRGPYDKTASLDFTPSVMRNLARRGWVGICQDVRGRYASEGEYRPFANEIEDGVDSVEWAAAQPWSDGKVGMFGISYNGWTGLGAAVGRAPSLRCIYPGMIGYGMDSRRLGIPQLQGTLSWLLTSGQGQEERNRHRIDLNHLPLHEIDEHAGYPNRVFDAFASDEDFNISLSDETAKAEEVRDLAGIESKIYYVAGWYDELITETLDTWCQIRKTSPDTKLMIGPWHHNLCEMEEPRIGKVPTDDVELKRYYEQMEMFFAHHLKGEENEVSQSDAPVKLYVMGRNVWRDEHEWPLRRAEFKRLYLHSSGRAGIDLEDGVLDWMPPNGEQIVDEYDYDPLDPVDWTAKLYIWSYLNEMGDREEVQQRKDVLVYSTSVLEEEIEVTGAVTTTLYAASDAPDTDFVVNLVDVHPDGHTQFLCSGIIRARYRNGIDKPELIEPGKVYKYEIKLTPTSNVFLKGHRIRIEVTSSDFSRFARNQNVAAPPGQSSEVKVAHQTVFHTGLHLSHIVLPVIPVAEGNV